MDNLKITYEDPETLILDPNNARSHPEPNLSAIRASLKQFGFRKTSIAAWEKTHVVYAGNGILKVALELGFEQVPVAWIPADWTESRCKAFGISDNQTALLAEWDLPKLDVALEELKLDFDLNDLGFSEVDLDILFRKDGLPDGFREYDESIENEVKMIKCPSCGHEFPK